MNFIILKLLYEKFNSYYFVNSYMEIITGLLGFVLGSLTTLLISKKLNKNKTKEWNKGYKIIRKDLFPKKEPSKEIPIYASNQNSNENNSSNTINSNTPDNKEDPKMPNWF